MVLKLLAKDWKSSQIAGSLSVRAESDLSSNIFFEELREHNDFAMQITILIRF